MSLGSSRWTVGIAVAAVLVIVASMFAIPGAVTLLFGGLFMTVGSAGIGALGAEHLNQADGDSQCIVDGAGATTASQSEYVRTIVGVGKDLDVDKDGQIVAVMVALAESGLQNYANDGGNHFGFEIPGPKGTDFWLKAVKYSMSLPHDAVGKDADSVGLFQQRPSAGWADTEGFKAADDTEKAINRLMNPEFSARAFYGGPGGVANKGLKDVPGWESMEPTRAAQAVQVSDVPSAYAEWEEKATSLVEANSDAPAISPGEGDSSDSGDGDSSSSSSSPSSSSSSSSSGEADTEEASSSSEELTMPMKEGTYELTSKFGNRESPGGGSTDHKGLDFGADVGTPIVAPADGTVAAAGSASGFGYWVVLDHTIGGKKWSTVYGHVTSDSIKVSKGDEVQAGDEIAGVGNEGTSTGPHLHFETWDGGRFAGGKAVDPEQVVSGDYSGSVSAADGSGEGCTTQNASSEGGDSEGGGGDVEAVIKEGESQIGVDYSWGGGTKNGPSEGFGRGAGVKGFDCSSLMQYMAYQGAKHDLPRTAAEQYEATKSNQVGEPGDGVDGLKPGDLLFWGGSASSINHVAMYVGDGQMIEAPRTGLKVRTTEARVDDSTYFGATRINYSQEKA